MPHEGHTSVLLVKHLRSTSSPRARIQRTAPLSCSRLTRSALRISRAGTLPAWSRM